MLFKAPHRPILTCSDELKRTVQLVNKARKAGAQARLRQLNEAIRILVRGRSDALTPWSEADRSSARDFHQLEALLEELLDFPSRRLAVYGTLAPGEVNHHVLACVAGRWTTGWVRGVLGRIGPYPALQWKPEGRRVPVHVLHSAQLDRHFSRLDRFEGPRYRRIWVAVETPGGGLSIATLFEAVTLTKRPSEDPARSRR